MRVPSLLAPLALLLVAGCALINPPAAPPVAATPPVVIAAPEPAPPPPTAAANVPLPRAKPPVPVNRPTPAAAPPSPIIVTPRPDEPLPRLVGLSQDETTAMLGPPASERVAGAAKIWRYQAGQCRLDVQFFLDVSRNAFYALDYAAAGQESSADARDRCLVEVLNDRRKP